MAYPNQAHVESRRLEHLTRLRADPNYHKGRPSISQTTDGSMVIVKCPAGHLVTGMPTKHWAGSWMEAKAGDKTWEVECIGTLPKRT